MGAGFANGVEVSSLDNLCWKPIPGYEGSYEVSDTGLVRSLDRTVKGPGGFPKRIKGTVLSPSTGRYGYQRVNLHKDGNVVTRQVQQLVMLAFVGPRPLGYDTCHCDGDPRNNDLSNLRYDTKRANQMDRIRHGRNEKYNRTHCPRGHLLGGVNNVPSQAKRGHRDCLACARARNHRKSKGLTESEFIALSHKFYAALGVVE